MKKEAALGDADAPVPFKAGLNAWTTVGSSIRNGGLRNLFKGKLRACATLSPLLLALIVVGGLGVLCVENLVGVQHTNYDHSEAIFKLLFRN